MHNRVDAKVMSQIQKKSHELAQSDDNNEIVHQLQTFGSNA